MIRTKQKGSFKNLSGFLKRSKTINLHEILDKYGKMGVAELTLHTPSDSGKTATSWYYTIDETSNGARLTFCNSNTRNGANVAILIQYGYATKSGYRVVGKDYINPVLNPLYSSMVSEIEGKVKTV